MPIDSQQTIVYNRPGEELKVEKLKQLGRNLQAHLQKLEQLKKNINQFLAEAESAEFVLNKTVLDMKKRLSEAKALVATAMAEEQRLLKAYRKTVDTAKEWGQKADIALRNADTATARDALQHQHRQKQLANRYKNRLAEQKERVASLKTALREFYQQFQNAAKLAETLGHRQKQAEARAKLYQLLNAADTDVSKAFEQAEQKLKEAEAKAEIWEEQHRRAATHVENTEDGFNLDEALAELKRDILDSGQK